MPQAQAPKVPVSEGETKTPQAKKSEKRPAKFKVKNISKSPLNLLSGTIDVDKTGTITNGEYSYLYKRVERV